MSRSGTSEKQTERSARDMRIRQRLEELRRVDRTWTQKRLATEAKVSEAVVSRFLAGEMKRPGADVIAKLERVLGLESPLSSGIRVVEQTDDPAELALLTFPWPKDDVALTGDEVRAITKRIRGEFGGPDRLPITAITAAIHCAVNETLRKRQKTQIVASMPTLPVRSK